MELWTAWVLECSGVFFATHIFFKGNEGLSLHLSTEGRRCWYKKPVHYKACGKL
jgi:hypothetical protein